MKAPIEVVEGSRISVNIGDDSINSYCNIYFLIRFQGEKVFKELSVCSDLSLTKIFSCYIGDITGPIHDEPNSHWLSALLNVVNDGKYSDDRPRTFKLTQHDGSYRYCYKMLPDARDANSRVRFGLYAKLGVMETRMSPVFLMLEDEVDVRYSPT